jgi:hypothetical protein
VAERLTCFQRLSSDPVRGHSRTLAQATNLSLGGRSYSGAVRCWTSILVLLATGALAIPATAVPAGTPVISVSLKVPRVGDRAAVSVAGVGSCRRVVAVSPSGSQYSISLRRQVGACRGLFRFSLEGRWTLHFGRMSRIIRVLVALPAPHPSGARLGRAGCEPASPLTPGRDGVPEAFGTAVGGHLWALFFHGTRTSESEASFAGMVGEELKLVLKSTAGTTLTSATAPDGTERRPVWQQGHSGSNWERAGVEWGTGWQITEPGCWRIHVGPRTNGGDLWFRVVS